MAKKKKKEPTFIEQVTTFLTPDTTVERLKKGLARAEREVEERKQERKAHRSQCKAYLSGSHCTTCITKEALINLTEEEVIGLRVGLERARKEHL